MRKNALIIAALSVLTVALMLSASLVLTAPSAEAEDTGFNGTYKYAISIDGNDSSVYITGVTDKDGNSTTNLTSSSLGSWGWDANYEYGPFNSYYAAFDPEDGTMVCHIRANDLTKAIDGTDISSFGYNIMWCLPTVYWSVGTGGSLILTDDATSGGTAYAHTINGKVYKYLGIGVYETSLRTIDETSHAASVSGVSPTVSTSVDDFDIISKRTNVEDGYAMQWNWYQYSLYRYCVYAVLGTLDSQSFAMGVTSVNNPATTGLTNTSSDAIPGYYSDGSDTTASERLFIENMWGSATDFIGLTYGVSSGSYYASQKLDSTLGDSSYVLVATGCSGADYGSTIATTATGWGVRTSTGGSGSSGTFDYSSTTGWGSQQSVRTGGQCDAGLSTPDDAYKAGVNTVNHGGRSGTGPSMGSRMSFVYDEDPFASKTITLDKNGGDLDGAINVDSEGSIVADSYEAASKTGSILKGYYTASTGGDLVLKVTGGVASFVTDDVTGYVTGGKWVGGDKSLYAQWKDAPVASDFSFETPADTKYNGNVQSATVTTDKSGMGTITVHYYSEAELTNEIDANDVKNAGTYYVAIDVAEGTEYASATKLRSDDWILTIDPRNITLTSGSDTRMYDGTPLTSSTVTVSGDGFVTGEGATYNVTGSQTDFGTSSNTFTYTLNSGTKECNYEVTTVEGDLFVIKRSITFSTYSQSKMYDGTPLTSSEVWVTGDGFATGEGATYNVTGSQTDFGTSSNTFTYTLNSGTKECNYDITTVYGDLMVGKRSVTMSSGSAGKMYDGSAITSSNVSVTGDGFITGEGATYNVTGSQTDYGSSPNAFTYTLNSGTKECNYEVTTVEGTLQVVKRSVTLTSASATKVYDKTPLKNSTVTVSGDGFATGEGATYDVTGSQKDVGKSDNTFTYDLNAGTTVSNYNITTVFGELSVTKRSVDVPEELYYIYTGSEITFDIPTSDYYSIEDKPKKGTDVGTYTYVLTLDTNCVWSPADFDGKYNVYITEESKSHINDDGKKDVIITGDDGIRGDLTLVVTSTKDVTDIKEKFKFDGEAKYSYDIKLMKDSQEVQPEGEITLAILFPSNVSRYSYLLYHIHGDVCEKLDSHPEGDYAIATVDDLSDFVFVVPEKGETSNNALYIVLGAVGALAVLVFVASRLIKKKSV